MRPWPGHDRHARRDAPRPPASGHMPPGRAAEVRPMPGHGRPRRRGRRRRWSRVASASHSRSHASDNGVRAGRVATTSACRRRIASRSASPATTACGAPGRSIGGRVPARRRRRWRRRPSAYTSPILTSGVKSIRRIAVATSAAASSGRPCQSASSARLAWTGPMNWMSAARSASGASGRRRAAASSNRPRARARRPSSSCTRISLIPSGPTSSARRAARSLSSHRPSRYRKSRGSAQHVRPEEAHQAQGAPTAAIPTSATATASSSRPPTSRIQIQFA